MDITDLLSKDWITLNTQANNKWDVIIELIDLLYINNRINSPDMFFSDVKEREKQVSTGVGFGIAIPHAKSSAVLKTSIAFARSNSGIEYDSIDNELVNLIFLLAIPDTINNDEYLRILANLSRSLVHETVRENLILAESYNDIVEAIINRE